MLVVMTNDSDAEGDVIITNPFLTVTVMVDLGVLPIRLLKGSAPR